MSSHRCCRKFKIDQFNHWDIFIVFHLRSCARREFLLNLILTEETNFFVYKKPNIWIIANVKPMTIKNYNINEFFSSVGAFWFFSSSNTLFSINSLFSITNRVFRYFDNSGTSEKLGYRSTEKKLETQSCTLSRTELHITGGGRGSDNRIDWIRA